MVGTLAGRRQVFEQPHEDDLGATELEPGDDMGDAAGAHSTPSSRVDGEGAVDHALRA